MMLLSPGSNREKERLFQELSDGEFIRFKVDGSVERGQVVESLGDENRGINTTTLISRFDFRADEYEGEVVVYHLAGSFYVSGRKKVSPPSVTPQGAVIDEIGKARESIFGLKPLPFKLIAVRDLSKGGPYRID